MISQLYTKLTMCEINKMSENLGKILNNYAHQNKVYNAIYYECENENCDIICARNIIFTIHNRPFICKICEKLYCGKHILVSKMICFNCSNKNDKPFSEELNNKK